MERGPVELPRDGRVCEQGLDLGGEEERARALPVVERLLAETVARDEETAPARVPHREGEHAAQVLHARLAVTLPRAQEDLRIARGREARAGRVERRSEIAEVVDLAVEDQM